MRGSVREKGRKGTWKAIGKRTSSRCSSSRNQRRGNHPPLLQQDGAAPAVGARRAGQEGLRGDGVRKGRGAEGGESGRAGGEGRPGSRNHPGGLLEGGRHGGRSGGRWGRGTGRGRRRGQREDGGGGGQDPDGKGSSRWGALCPEWRHLQEGRHRARLEGRSPEEAGPDQSQQGQGQAQGRESPWRWYKVLTKIKGCHKQLSML